MTLGHNLCVRCILLLCSIMSKAWTSQSERHDVPCQLQAKRVGLKHKQGWTSTKWTEVSWSRRIPGECHSFTSTCPIHRTEQDESKTNACSERTKNLKASGQGQTPNLAHSSSGKGSRQLRHTTLLFMLPSHQPSAHPKETRPRFSLPRVCVLRLSAQILQRGN